MNKKSKMLIGYLPHLHPRWA